MFTSLREAGKYAGVTPNTVLIWTDQYDIGEMREGRWHIDKDKLDKVLDARRKLAALRKAG